MYDIIIIGAGVTGCAVARYLSRYEGRMLVLEKAEDVCCGTSKANSAIIHAGFDAAHGSLMAKMNLEGNLMMPQLAKDLDFAFKMNGSLVVCMSEEDLPKLRALYENGVKNGVKELEIVDAKRLHELEPNVSKNAVAALWAPTGGIVCPFNLTIALAENAFDNGVEFQFNTEVTGFTWNDGYWTIHTNHGEFETRYVINAAGVYSDVLHNMVSTRKLHITPRRGDYCLLDKSTGDFVSHTIFQLPGKLGKGVLVSPTVHGNTIVGPTAIDIEDREGTNTTAEGLNDLIEKAGATVENLPIRQTITSFAGLRAHEDHHEFVIGEAEGTQQFIDCAGIESPGLTSSPAIGLHVSELMRDLKLNTVCKAANCPNLGECYQKHTATFMILGDVCTRNCRFCNVTCGKPLPPDPDEPENVAQAAKKLGLRHVVLTCSTRDDLPDGGAEHFAKTVRAIRALCPGTTVETLTSDMKGSHEAADIVIAAHPDVFNLNIETVKELQKAVRPQAGYERTLGVLRYVKEKDPTILTKTGFMVGLGETDEQISVLMDDILATGCDILTIGQYLQPSEKHWKLDRYATPEDFARYKQLALSKGFRHVASAPLARSSYRAWEALEDVHDLY